MIKISNSPKLKLLGLMAGLYRSDHAPKQGEKQAWAYTEKTDGAYKERKPIPHIYREKSKHQLIQREPVNNRHDEGVSKQHLLGRKAITPLYKQYKQHK